MIFIVEGAAEGWSVVAGDDGLTSVVDVAASKTITLFS